MNWQTKQKAEEIKILLNEGYDLKDILQKKFNRSTSKLKEHLQVAKGIYTELEFSILEGKENAVEKYVGFLKSGGSDYPIEILKKAGVDMTTSEPLQATIDRFNELLEMLEKEI